MGSRQSERALGKDDEGYPSSLRNLSSPPDPVFLTGPWNHSGPHVAIVGTRDPTADGIDVTKALARSLAGRGVAIVSGLARGIDAAAHEAALEAGGLTGAVLGTSLEEIYPPEHHVLQSRVARSLGLMCEIPPGKPTTRATFATRNRMLAALADVVVVVQGRTESGAVITAKAARRLGRPVAAVPWDSRDPLGEAPHELIRSRLAVLVCSADDIMKLLPGGAFRHGEGDARTPRSGGRERSGSGATGPAARGVARVAPIDIEKLRPAEAALYRALRDHPRSLDDLAFAASLKASELSVALVALELAGLVSRLPGGLIRKTRVG